MSTRPRRPTMDDDGTAEGGETRRRKTRAPRTRRGVRTDVARRGIRRASSSPTVRPARAVGRSVGRSIGRTVATFRMSVHLTHGSDRRPWSYSSVRADHVLCVFPHVFVPHVFFPHACFFSVRISRARACGPSHARGWFFFKYSMGFFEHTRVYGDRWVTRSIAAPPHRRGDRDG